MPEKVRITVEDMLEVIGVCERLAAEREPQPLPPDVVQMTGPSELQEREARALRLAAAMMRSSVVGTIAVPDTEALHA